MKPSFTKSERNLICTAVLLSACYLRKFAAHSSTDTSAARQAEVIATRCDAIAAKLDRRKGGGR